MTHNEDKYKKSVQLKFRYCLGLSKITISLFITCIPAKEKDFEIGHFRNFQTFVTLTLHRIIWHTVMYHSSTAIYTPNFVEIGKTFHGRRDGCTDGRTDGRTDIETGFITPNSSELI